MLIIRYSGGLGNQMFQYAFARVLQNTYPDLRIKGDLEHYRLYKVHSGFEIEKCFLASLDKASAQEIRRISDRLAIGFCINFLPPTVVNIIEKEYSKLRKNTKNIIRQEKFNIYDSGLFDRLNKNCDYYIEGEWQNWKYFEGNETLLYHIFQFRKKIENTQDISWLNAIRNTNSVSIHVRRGDFVNSSSHDLCGEFYYKSAISYILETVENPQFFIFSDDINYCKQLFKELDAVYITHSKSDAVIDMQLMSLCKHNIIPNSTFSFWAAVLNQNTQKCVVCPKYSFKEKENWLEFETPKQWKKINNRYEGEN